VDLALPSGTLGQVTPRIAVAVTTYNQSRYVAETVNSVLGQSLRPSEIVVVDDGSTDSTREVLAQFRDRVRLITQQNAGVAAARNAAVLACSAEYVALLDGDDLWHPDKLRRCAQLLSDYPDSSLLAHDIERISADGQVLNRGEIAARLTDWHLGETAVVHCLERLIQGNLIWTTSQVVVRRRAYIDAGLSDSSFAIASDYDLYLRLAARGPFLLDSRVLTQWRQHDESASGKGLQREFNWAVDMAQVLEKARTRSELTDYQSAIDCRQDTIVHMLYSSESRVGRWPTARALAQIAWKRRNAFSAFAAAAVLLTPQSMRRRAASITGVSVSART
jgi:glycosyltransferase involved in cell wall biosynthesis